MAPPYRGAISLEALERIADKVDKITVVGGMNALLERTVKVEAG
ncbi:MAG: hypothetical protein R2724_24415 [Bryobacterales bacterium]